MCGITGGVNRDKQQMEVYLERSSLIQKHRGPDIQDSCSLEIHGNHIGLSHQRLSILDLTDAGRQPMSSDNEGSVIVYNGEVYNYIELKKIIVDYNYKSDTDTEVVLNLLERKGIDKALNMFNGMWAFAWLDTKNCKLYLCRDRAGVKPLYYYVGDEGFYFSSEVKALLEGVGKIFALDEQAIGEYLFQSLQDTNNNSFFKEIKALPAGHYLELDVGSNELNYKLKQYWSVLDAPKYSGDNLEKEIRDIFYDSVRIRMRSDVPIGVTLSGGLDSSAIAAVMKKILGESDNMNVLSAVAPGTGMDESEFIDEMTAYLHVDATKIEFNWKSSEALALLKEVTWYNDSPAGSFSNVAHYLMMKKAKELGITVILSGQGADELLCGYKKYLAFYLQYLVRNNRYFKAIKLFACFVINKSIVNQFNFKEAKRYLPKILRGVEHDIRGPRLREHYKAIFNGLGDKQTLQSRQADDLERFSVPFLTHYEDRMSMAWSREIRLPFLDYRLMELFVNLPEDKKLAKGWTKYIFRKSIEQWLPSKIVWRKDKQGFVNPQEQWLKNELKQDVLSMFNDSALIFKLGLIDRRSLLNKYEEYCNETTRGGKIWYRDIFAPLALEIWLQLYSKYYKHSCA